MDMSARARETRENSIGWMIQRLGRKLDDAMNARLAEYEINLQQFAIMMTVLEHGSLTQAEIGRRFAMPAYAISRALDALEGAGYLVRDDHPSSRRAHQIRATEKGIGLGPDLFAIVRSVNADLTQGLTANDAEQLKALLTRTLYSTEL